MKQQVKEELQQIRAQCQSGSDQPARNLADQFDLVEVKRRNAIRLKAAVHLRSTMREETPLAKALDEELKEY